MTTKRSATTVLDLQPTPAMRAALQDMLEAYRRAMAILDTKQGANVVALHKVAYEEIRAATGLPARLVTLALRDHGRRRIGAPVDDIPLDGKLFAVKGPDRLSLATTSGRIVLPYVVAGHREGWTDFAEARLIFSATTIRIHAGIQAGLPPMKEGFMSDEGILSRLGRVIAGVVNTAVDAAEAANPVAVAEQALREIDGIADEARAALGRAVAAGHRLEAKAEDLDAEIRDLDGKIRLGLESGREDLARAATGVQIDLEAQRAALDKALADNGREIAEAEATLRSIASARADAQKRLEDAKRVERPTMATSTASQRNDQRLADALRAVERVTGVPVKPPMDGTAEVEELGRLQRQKAIEDRLKAYKRDQS